MEQLSGIQIIIAGYRRCGTTYLHDFFSSIEEVNVLKKKEEDRLLISSKLWESGVKPYITNKDTHISVIVHPMLAMRPECLRVLVECCETPMVVFLRRPAYERAKSEFQMLVRSQVELMEAGALFWASSTGNLPQPIQSVRGGD